jgi:GTP-binding protein
LKIKSAQFELSATSLDSCPESELPEFAFIGRSNVGKSSLINLLCNKDGLARVSSTPGRTREINFFTINNRAWCLVDLPGYGYAKVSKSSRRMFSEFISDYLTERSNLVCAFVLIDSRHSPQKIDQEFVQWLAENKIPFALVFTKTDKVSATVVRTNIELFQKAMAEWTDGVADIFTTSAKKGEGYRQILGFVGDAIS